MVTIGHERKFISGNGEFLLPLDQRGGGGEAKMKHYMNVHLGNVGGKERREGVL